MPETLHGYVIGCPTCDPLCGPCPVHHAAERIAALEQQLALERQEVSDLHGIIEFWMNGACEQEDLAEQADGKLAKVLDVARKELTVWLMIRDWPSTLDDGLDAEFISNRIGRLSAIADLCDQREDRN